MCSLSEIKPLQKAWTFLFPSSGLNNTTIVLLKGWLKYPTKFDLPLNKDNKLSEPSIKIINFNVD